MSRPSRTDQDPARPRRPARCPASPLAAAGVILTLTGAALYTMPAERPGLIAAGALVLAAIAAWWCASRQG
ncbi:hypothetical protein GCM10010215_25420 [Streptomyces virginiae]|uniref:Uncharacterized protein n=1 Tax=Streptomyces virginiae TaxID=1961 RepID=A0ABQ3NNF9_STRVG|nr:hypothetical protein [Streptomyces virginiae]MBP2341850.1 hypothetical protein [Streptomyces virginiae]GGP98641.1 hypothetical protein GCM10010215_25420 [Streptomyces virginiae]GHI14279.1 hypothetical protein Scinn_37420 [Streptomyces virginiae]